MKKAGRILLVGMLLALSAPAGAMPVRGPEPQVRYERGAFATFTFPQDGTKNEYPFVAVFVLGYSVDGGEEELFGYFLEGECEEERGNGWASVGCASSEGVGGRLRAGEFEMDPALRLASLTMRRKDTTFRAQWIADKGPGAYEASEWCFKKNKPEGEGHGGGLIQEAIASGEAFGRKLKASGRWIDWAMMDQGGMVSQCKWPTPRTVEALRDGRYEDVRFELTRDGF